MNIKVARIWDDYTSSIPLETIEKYPELYGPVTQASTLNPVRNTTQQLLFFNNSEYFRPTAIAFEKSKEEVKGTDLDACYTSALEGTKAYKDFWEQERLRCLQGYEPIIDGQPCGVRITGEHYFYLNYCMIGKAVKNEITGEDTEELGFPRFTSMDYYFYHELEMAENPPEGKMKENLIIAKARRKGFSYKNAAGAVWKYSFFKNSRIVIAAELGIKAKQTFDMALNMIDFLNQYTEFRSPWTHRKTGENKCFIRSGVEVEKNGRKYTKGKKSVIETISFHNKPDAAAGIGATRILIEEAGLITDLKRAWKFTEPLLRSGKIRKGIALAWGTGGQMDGSTQDFAEMMTDPESHSFKAYDNIYEEHDSRGKSGWFVDDMWFREGAWVEVNGVRYEAVDKNGNARKWVAEIDLNHERSKLAGKDKDTYNVALSQYCKTLSEAFLVTTGNIFPVAELSSRLSILKTPDGARLSGAKGELVEKNGVVYFKPDIEGKLEALDRYPTPKSKKSLEGCVVQFEAPQELNGTVPDGAYIISVDPIGIDSAGGESLVAITCLKTKKYAHLIGHDEIVMNYVGRPKIDPLDTTNWILLKMAKYYNAKVSHENDRNGAFIRNFFIQQKEYLRLCRPPSDIIEKYVPNSSTALRKTGHSMGSVRLKEVGEIYLKRWLLESRGLNPVTGLEERNVDKLCDRGLIEELLSYRRDGNFDRCLALMGAVLQQEQMLFQLTETEEETVSDSAKFFLERLVYLPSMGQNREKLRKTIKQHE